MNMKTSKKCKWFKLYELLPPDMYRDENTGWNLIEDNLKETIDILRELFKVPLIINNWFWKGKRVASGLRPEKGGIGAIKSRHRIPYGDAVDIISTKMTTQQMWQIIDNNKDKLPYPIRIEKTSAGKPITWLHVDMNNTNKEKIYYFNA